METSLPQPRLAMICFPLLAALVLSSTPLPITVTEAGASDEPKAVTIYDPDPKHLWNRLHKALHVTVDPADTGNGFYEVGLGELDPLPHYHSTYLLREPVHREVISLLDEFLAKNGEKLIQDSFKRASLQRDLWVLFDWSADPMWLRLQDKKEQMLPERRALQTRLAKIIKRLALTTEKIKALPDNYAATIAAKTFAARFDPAREKDSFLPPDLWEPEGPWVLLGDREGRPLARTHLQFFGGRSTFLVFLRLPEGRDQTVKYLESLRTWSRSGRKRDVPQFPVMTQVALVRKTLLVNDKGEIVVTPLTESVQLRVFRRIDDEVVFRKKPAPENLFEFKMPRSDLLAGKPVLNAVGDKDGGRAFVLRMGRDIHGGGEHVLATCASCHQGPGILSVNSYTGFRDNDRRDLHATSRDREVNAMVDWKNTQDSLKLLRELNKLRTD